MNTQLFERTLALAENLPENVTMVDVCREAGTTYRWWQYVLEGRIADPGVHRMQRVHDVMLEKGASIPYACECA